MTVTCRSDADTIESLRSELDEAIEDRKQTRDDLARAAGMVVVLRARAEKAEQERDTLRARVAELEAEIESFDEAARAFLDDQNVEPWELAATASGAMLLPDEQRSLGKWLARLDAARAKGGG
jgi:chromosome segregation ATPase